MKHEEDDEGGGRAQEIPSFARQKFLKSCMQNTRKPKSV